MNNHIKVLCGFLGVEGLTVQTFDDAEAKNTSLSHIIFLAPDNAEELARLKKLQAVGAGIFFSFNKQAPLSQRGIKHTTECKAIGLDLDAGKQKAGGATKEQKESLLEAIFKLPLSPTIIIETRNGYQPLWVFSSPKLLNISERDSVNENYKKLVESFTSTTGLPSEGDSISRVLRLPGSYHLKDRNHPFLIKLVPDFYGGETTLEEWTRYYGNGPHKKTETAPNEQGLKEIAEQFGYYAACNNLNESEARTWRGKNYRGRDELLTAVIGSVLWTERINDEVKVQLIHYLNNLMTSPLPADMVDYKIVYLNKKQKPNNKSAEINPIDLETDDLGQTFAEDESSIFEISSGNTLLDKAVKIKSGNAYLVAGLEKSGKTMEVIQISSKQLHDGVRVAYLDTELGPRKFLERMAAIHYDIPISNAEADKEKQSEWHEKYVKNEKLFQYVWLAKNNKNFDVEQFRSDLETVIDANRQVIFIDNLTKFYLTPNDTEAGWVKLGKALEVIISLAQTKNVIIFAVLHTKSGELKEKILTQKIKKILDDPEIIFENSAEINYRPSLAKVYGGAAALSQVSGGVIFVWRPYQNFASKKLQRIACLVLESFRDGTKFDEIVMDFDPERLRFTEKRINSVNTPYDQSEAVGNVDKTDNKEDEIDSFIKGLEEDKEKSQQQKIL